MEMEMGTGMGMGMDMGCSRRGMKTTLCSANGCQNINGGKDQWAKGAITGFPKQMNSESFVVGGVPGYAHGKGIV